MPAPELSDLPDAPLRSETPATFTAKAEAWVAALTDTFTPEMQAFIDYLNTLGLDPEDVPTDATDLNMATGRILGRTTAGTGATEELTASQVRNLLLLEEWAPNFTAAGDMYIPADAAMTIIQGNAKIGTGTLAYAKSTNAAPGTFTSTTLPATLEAGAWLKITASGVTGFVATHLRRTA